MQKRILSVFEFKSYHSLLLEDFMLRSTRNQKYSLRAYSRDLEISPTFLSDLLRGKRELSLQKGREVFTKLGLSEEELEYVSDLITYNISKNPLSKGVALENILKKHKSFPMTEKNELTILIKSIDHFMLHGIIQCVSDEQTILKMANSINVSDERAKVVLEELTISGQIEKISDTYKIVNDSNTLIPDGDAFFSTQLQYVDRLLSLISQQGGANPPDSYSNFLVFCSDDKTYPLMADAYKQFYATIIHLSNQSQEMKRLNFISSTLCGVSF